VNVFAALELGITTLESSVGGLGGVRLRGSDRQCLHGDMVYMFKNGEFTGIDLMN
jgi:hypothetical protein